MIEDDSPREGQFLICEHCGAPHDPDDEFCRRCGASLTGSRVPAVRRNYQPVVYRPAVPIVVQGAVAIAAGTLAEIVLKRLIKRLFRPRSLLPVLRRDAKKPVQVQKRQDDGEEPDAQIESETIVLRQIRLRRRRRSG
jgi:predicted amidophosphoribosyltransferase